MKALKFWAETPEDAENFANMCRANNHWREGNDCWDYKQHKGLFIDEAGYICHQYNDREYFKEHKYEEFFFPMKGNIVTKYAVIRITKKGRVKQVFLQDGIRNKVVTEDKTLAEYSVTRMRESFPEQNYQLVSWEE